jgi:hypothetical protein
MVVNTLTKAEVLIAVLRRLAAQTREEPESTASRSRGGCEVVHRVQDEKLESSGLGRG